MLRLQSMRARPPEWTDRKRAMMTTALCGFVVVLLGGMLIASIRRND